MFNKRNFANTIENHFGSFVSLNMFCIPHDSPLVIKGAREITNPNDLIGKR